MSSKNLPEYYANNTVIIAEYYNQLMIINCSENSNNSFAAPLFSVKKNKS